MLEIFRFKETGSGTGTPSLFDSTDDEGQNFLHILIRNCYRGKSWIFIKVFKKTKYNCKIIFNIFLESEARRSKIIIKKVISSLKISGPVWQTRCNKGSSVEQLFLQPGLFDQAEVEYLKSNAPKVKEESPIRQISVSLKSKFLKFLVSNLFDSTHFPGIIVTAYNICLYIFIDKGQNFGNVRANP